MADLDISIGGRSYTVACEDGQEPHLAAMAETLAGEAAKLRRQFGAQANTLPETRLLLMAGLMVADKLHARAAEAEEAAIASAPERSVAPEPPVERPRAPAAQPGLFEDPVLLAKLEEATDALEAAVARAETAEADAADMRAALEEGADRSDALAHAQARIAELEAERDAAVAAEAEALKALDDATRRVRVLTTDLQGDADGAAA